MDILEKIDKLRVERGWSINKLAEEAVITQSTLSNMFSRRTMPSITTLTSICKGLDITLSEFFAENDSEQKTQDEIRLLKSYRTLSDKNKKAIQNLISNLE